MTDRDGQAQADDSTDRAVPGRGQPDRAEGIGHRRANRGLSVADGSVAVEYGKAVQHVGSLAPGAFAPQGEQRLERAARHPIKWE
jgi:hypothetical protein